jgi:hypothetical protein
MWMIGICEKGRSMPLAGLDQAPDHRAIPGKRLQGHEIRQPPIRHVARQVQNQLDDPRLGVNDTDLAGGGVAALHGGQRLAIGQGFTRLRSFELFQLVQGGGLATWDQARSCAG